MTRTAAATPSRGSFARPAISETCRPARAFRLECAEDYRCRSVKNQLARLTAEPRPTKTDAAQLFGR